MSNESSPDPDENKDNSINKPLRKRRQKRSLYSARKSGPQQSRTISSNTANTSSSTSKEKAALFFNTGFKGTGTGRGRGRGRGSMLNIFTQIRSIIYM